jgi:hypothetical protein
LDIYIRYEGQIHLLERWRIQCTKVSYSTISKQGYAQLMVLARALFTYLIVLPSSKLHEFPRNVSFALSNKPNITYDIDDQLFGAAKLSQTKITDSGTTFDIIGRYRNDISQFMKPPNDSGNLSQLLIPDYFEDAPKPLQTYGNFKSWIMVEQDSTNIGSFIAQLNQALGCNLEGNYKNVTHQNVMDEFQDLKNMANEVFLE